MNAPEYRSHTSRIDLFRKARTFASGCLSVAISAFAIFDLGRLASTGSILSMHKDGSKEVLTFASDPMRFGIVLTILVFALFLFTPHAVVAILELRSLFKDRASRR
jgi:hypothetical protein